MARRANPSPNNPKEARAAAAAASDVDSSKGKGQARSRPRTNVEAGDELGAADLARRVAEALRGFRRERHLSLDDLSARSGVSRAALSQIEGGRTNPTLAVLWKIAVGLEVPFHDLMGIGPTDAAIVLRAGDAPPLRTADGRMESRLLSPGGSTTDTEVYELKLLPKALHKADPHARGTSETVVVMTGALRLTVGTNIYELAPGDSVFFRADVGHAYENRSTRETRCINVIHYDRV